MKKLLTAAASIALVSALSISAVAAEKLKVGFIYIGPPGDHGWTYQHDQGRQAIDAALGDQVETVFVENVPKAQMQNVQLHVWLAKALVLSSPLRSATWILR